MFRKDAIVLLLSSHKKDVFDNKLPAEIKLLTGTSGFKK